MRIIQSLLLSLLLLPGVNLANKIVLTPEQASNQFKQLSIAAEIEQIQTADIKQMTELVDNLLQSNNQSSLRKEKLLHVITETISQQIPTTERRRILDKLAGYQSTVYWQMEHGGRTQLMLAYPVAGLAVSTSTHWRINDAVKRLSPNKRIDVYALENYLTTADKFEAEEMFNRLVAQLPLAEKQQLANWAGQEQHNVSSVMLFSLANQLSDKSIYEQAVNQLMTQTDQRPVASTIARHLVSMKNQLSASESSQLLMQLTHSEQFGSLAIQQLSGNQSDLVQGRLFELLGNKQLGGDAALVLSKQLNTDSLMKLEQALASPDDIKARRSLMVLKSSKHPMAKQIIAEFVASQPDTQLAKEVNQ